MYTVTIVTTYRDPTQDPGVDDGLVRACHADLGEAYEHAVINLKEYLEIEDARLGWRLAKGDSNG